MTIETGIIYKNGILQTVSQDPLLMEGEKTNNTFTADEETVLFNMIINERGDILNKQAEKNGKPIETEALDLAYWINFETCTAVIAANFKYQKAHCLERLAEKYYFPAVASLKQYDYNTRHMFSGIATESEVLAYLDNGITEDYFICKNRLQILQAIQLHHLRTTNKRGFGELFMKCKVCGRYFLGRGNNAYCSDTCRAVAQKKQTERNADKPENSTLKRIRDRYNTRIKTAEKAGYKAESDRLRKELKDFQRERKKKKKELGQEEYIRYLEQKDQETKGKER